MLRVYPRRQMTLSLLKYTFNNATGHHAPSLLLGGLFEFNVGAGTLYIDAVTGTLGTPQIFMIKIHLPVVNGSQVIVWDSSYAPQVGFSAFLGGLYTGADGGADGLQSCWAGLFLQDGNGRSYCISRVVMDS